MSEKSMEKLTKGQKEALEAVRTGRNVCITGGGGVGKSYISRKIIEDLQKQRKTVLITASTGRAAMLIGGITCHRAFIWSKNSFQIVHIFWIFDRVMFPPCL
jgi:thymidylate kinase